VLLPEGFTNDGVRAPVRQQDGQRRQTPTRFHDSFSYALMPKLVSGNISGIIGLRRQYLIRAHPRIGSLLLTGASHPDLSVRLRLRSGIKTETVPRPNQWRGINRSRIISFADEIFMNRYDQIAFRLLTGFFRISILQAGFAPREVGSATKFADRKLSPRNRGCNPRKWCGKHGLFWALYLIIKPDGLAALTDQIQPLQKIFS